MARSTIYVRPLFPCDQLYLLRWLPDDTRKLIKSYLLINQKAEKVQTVLNVKLQQRVLSHFTQGQSTAWGFFPCVLTVLSMFEAFVPQPPMTYAQCVVDKRFVGGTLCKCGDERCQNNDMPDFEVTCMFGLDENSDMHPNTMRVHWHDSIPHFWSEKSKAFLPIGYEADIIACNYHSNLCSECEQEWTPASYHIMYDYEAYYTFFKYYENKPRKDRTEYLPGVNLQISINL